MGQRLACDYRLAEGWAAGWVGGGGGQRRPEITRDTPVTVSGYRVYRLLAVFVRARKSSLYRILLLNTESGRGSVGAPGEIEIRVEGAKSRGGATGREKPKAPVYFSRAVVKN
jgi:hypothetical protein